MTASYARNSIVGACYIHSKFTCLGCLDGKCIFPYDAGADAGANAGASELKSSNEDITIPTQALPINQANLSIMKTHGKFVLNLVQWVQGIKDSICW